MHFYFLYSNRLLTLQMVCKSKTNQKLLKIINISKRNFGNVKWYSRAQELLKSKCFIIYINAKMNDGHLLDVCSKAFHKCSSFDLIFSKSCML